MLYRVHRIENNGHLGIADRPVFDDIEADNFVVNENGDLLFTMGIPCLPDRSLTAYASGTWQRVERREKP